MSLLTCSGWFCSRTVAPEEQEEVLYDFRIVRVLTLRPRYFFPAKMNVYNLRKVGNF